ncbi:hypothetical protein [uncultured Nostoc sp.]|uniref:hypothetical protein n=1 Tax=uncultured Nostoc sp. TaxID=340711 RepID=UPI00261FA651|nr:hypothetical protein [uncultured Nostoc sp.]
MINSLPSPKVEKHSSLPPCFSVINGYQPQPSPGIDSAHHKWDDLLKQQCMDDWDNSR